MLRSGLLLVLFVICFSPFGFKAMKIDSNFTRKKKKKQHDWTITSNISIGLACWCWPFIIITNGSIRSMRYKIANSIVGLVNKMVNLIPTLIEFDSRQFSMLQIYSNSNFISFLVRLVSYEQLRFRIRFHGNLLVLHPHLDGAEAECHSIAVLVRICDPARSSWSCTST